jgi:hypothetical protein
VGRTTVLREVRRRIGAFGLLGVALYFFLLPGLEVAYDLADRRVSSGEIPGFAWRWHRSLAPRMADWARRRVQESRGAAVDGSDVAGTEWPMFGTVFFLAATESLQDAFERDPTVTATSPREYAANAIDAAAALLVDPANAAWVRAKWGADYLHRENVFYRMLLVMGLTSHARLRPGSSHLALLRDQVDTLGAEIDAAPSGMLDDYPGESYPTDVLWAVAAIRRADRVLGSDHAALVARFVEKCRAPRLLGRLGLLPYQADPHEGRALDDSRGCSNSGILVQAPDLSVEQAREWYDRYAGHFWQERALAVGFTEFPRDRHVEHGGDVDSGPIVLGYGFAASAFGLAAARANGRFDHAVGLAGLAIPAAWPLPDGTLLFPRVLSNATDAPYLGEAGMLYIFTRAPSAGVTIVPGHGYPWLVYALAVGFFGVAFALIATARRDLRSAPSNTSPTRETIAFVAWLTLLLAAFATREQPQVAFLLVLTAYAVPRRIAGA